MRKILVIIIQLNHYSEIMVKGETDTDIFILQAVANAVEARVAIPFWPNNRIQQLFEYIV